MVFLARDEQEGYALGILCVDPVFRPRVEVGGSGLEEGRAGTGDRKPVVELVGFVFLFMELPTLFFTLSDYAWSILGYSCMKTNSVSSLEYPFLLLHVDGTQCHLWNNIG